MFTKIGIHFKVPKQESSTPPVKKSFLVRLRKLINRPLKFLQSQTAKSSPNAKNKSLPNNIKKFGEGTCPHSVTVKTPVIKTKNGNVGPEINGQQNSDTPFTATDKRKTLPHNLTNEVLKTIDLSEYNLENADLSKMDLSERDLSGLNLTNANLSGAILSKAKLNKVQLKGANLQGVVAIDACFKDADLSEADLSRANLFNATLSSAKLIKTQLQEANLQGVTAFEANFEGTDLTKVNLTFAVLERSKFTGVKFQGADLSHCKFYDAILKEADLKGVIVHATVMHYADLDGADLSGIDLKNLRINNASLRDATMNIVPKGTKWNEKTLDHYLNPNTKKGSCLFTKISGINVKHPEVKIKLAHQVIESLIAENIAPDRLTSFALPLLTVLSMEPFLNDKVLADWIDNIIIERIRQYGAEHVTPDNVLRILQTFKNNPGLMLEENNLFHRLLDMSLSISSPAAKEAASEIYAAYLAMPEVAPHTRYKHFDRINKEDASAPPRISFSEKDATNLVLLPKSQDGSALLMSRDTLSGMLRTDPNKSVLSHFYMMSAPGVLDAFRKDLGTLFLKDFPEFYAPYRSADQIQRYGKLFDDLELGSLRSLFVDAIKVNRTYLKLDNTAYKIKLADVFQRAFREKGSRDRLSEAHAAMLTRTFGIDQATQETKAKYFLCLAAVITRLSSSYNFGSLDESPYWLRLYAKALMREANELHSSVCNSHQFTGWGKKLMSEYVEVDGTASLSDKMFQLSDNMFKHAREICPDILAAVRPIAWR